MPQFPCHACGHPFDLTDDESGSDVQCPTCGVLVSVPYASDLAGLNPDGTLRPVEPQADTTPPEVRAERLRQAYRNALSAPGKADAIDIDNRTLPEEIAIAPLPPPPPPAPRYDPETGELIRPIGLVPLRQPPVAARAESSANPALPAAAIAYANRSTPVADELPYGPWLQVLLQPANIGVISTIFVAAVIGAVMHGLILAIIAVWVESGGVYVAPWLFNVLFWLTLAHYGNVVEDAAEGDQDDLPRPLRELAPFGDVLIPLLRVLLAFGIAYTPAVLLSTSPGSPADAASMFVALVYGGAIFPAVLLATAAGGSFANLRPDRLLSAIRHGGRTYLRLAAVAIVLVPGYLHLIPGIDLLGTLHHPLTPAVANVPLAWNYPVPALALSVVAVYAAHAFCHELGLLFRNHRARLGWAWDELDRQQALERQRRFEARRQQAQARQADQSHTHA
jgi:hypothetical protein